ncbi:MAG: primosomal protein N' [Rhodospirillales bacterium]|nr:primosomal protein N' [Rhodospirillales bacterium]
MIFGVLLPLPFDEPFDYEFDGDLPIGSLVRVPWGKQEIVGVVWSKKQSSDCSPNKLKSIIKKYDFLPLNKEIIELVKFVSQYNMAPLGMVLKMVISVKQAFDDEPIEVFYELTGKTLAEAKLKNSDARWHVIDLLKHGAYTKAEICRGAGCSAGVVEALNKAGVIVGRQEIKKKQYNEPEPDFVRVKLTDEQQVAAENIVAKVGNGFSVTLIDGVTGSGKTEVYFEAAAEALKQHRQVLILVPEISLTAQWLARFEQRFGVKPACWHSGLGTRERTDNWIAAVEGRARVIVGARSALFLPYPDLGLIVIDESHDHSFKQEDFVNYQCRDMAVVRAKLGHFPLVLSTATPDLETVVNVENGKYDCVKLTKRFAGASLPKIKIVDLKKDKPQKGEWGPSWLAPKLVDALKDNLEKGEQSMLFLNRRGYAPLLICRDCGYRLQCPHCTAWLAEHRTSNKLICHRCGYMTDRPKVCPDCHSETGLTACGPGVERIAEEVSKRFPEARLRVLSSDTTSSVAELSKVFAEMERGELDIMVGTQILAKGHHFPELTLVGIVDADLGLMGSDLRASEQTFQLLSQVAGRAGRGGKSGEVIVQTLYPENAVLQALVDNDRNRFMELEKQTRKMLKMPPYGKLAAIIVSSEKAHLAEKIAVALGKTAPNTEYITTLGPAPAPVFMLRNKFRFRLLLKTVRNVNIQEVLKLWMQKVNVPNQVSIEIDIDPYSFM